MNNLNTRQLIHFIEQSLNAGLSPFIGEKVSNRRKDVVANTIDDFLKEQEHLGTIKDFKKTAVSTLWDNYTFKEKLKWYFCNKVFSFIGSKGRKKIDDYNNQIIETNTKLKQLHSDMLEHIDNKEEAPNLDDYVSDIIMETDTGFPKHLVSNPKTIIVTGITIRPFQSVDFININLEIPKR